MISVLGKSGTGYPTPRSLGDSFANQPEVEYHQGDWEGYEEWADSLETDQHQEVE